MSIDFRDKMTPQQKIERTRSILMKNHPFYATVACNIGWKIREDLPHPTAATDGLNVYWHPEFVNQCSDTEMEAVAIHEIHHVIKRHAFRKKRRDHELWNAACDYQINPELVEQGLKLPPKCLLDAKYKGMLEEHIYDDLLAKSNDGKGRPKFDPSSGYVMEPAEGTDAGMAERHLDGVIEQAAKIARDAGKLPGFLNDLFLRIGRLKLIGRLACEILLSRSSPATLRGATQIGDCCPKNYLFRVLALMGQRKSPS